MSSRTVSYEILLFHTTCPFGSVWVSGILRKIPMRASVFWFDNGTLTHSLFQFMLIWFGMQTPDRSMRRPSTRRPGVSSEPTTPEQQQPTAARRVFGSASTGRLARERSPATGLPPSPTLSQSPKTRSSSSTSTPTAVARRLFPTSLHGLSNGSSTARRR